MKNGRTELLREIASAKELKCLYHFKQESRPLEMERKIIKVQKNGVVRTTAGYLDIPQASLIWFDWHNKEFTVYDMGYRGMTGEEKSLLDEMNSLCTDEEQSLDLMSDGSTCYWREKRFRENHTIGNMSMETWYHKRYLHGKVRDPKIKGEKLYTFKLVY